MLLSWRRQSRRDRNAIRGFHLCVLNQGSIPPLRLVRDLNFALDFALGSQPTLMFIRANRPYGNSSSYSRLHLRILLPKSPSIRLGASD
jgi:hypothetical protein